MNTKDKKLPSWYADSINDLLMNGYASILERGNPEEHFFTFMYGAYDSVSPDSTLLKCVIHENDIVAKLQKIIAEVMRDRLKNKGFKPL